MTNFRRVIPMLAVCLAMVASCSKSKDQPDSTDPEAMAGASREELQQAITDRDQLLSLTAEIQQSLDEISSMEKIVSVSGSSETPDQRQQIKDKIAAIQQTLEDRRAKLDSLERKLSASNLYNSNMQKTIESLRTQIENQTAEIARLNDELNNAKATIAEQGVKIDSLNTTVTNVSNERDLAQTQSVELSNELNTCYVAIGSSKELKEHKILESGFLRKTKLMKGDFDQSYFTKKDKRTLTSIPLYSKNAEVLTNQPKDSYTITDVNGQKVLTITNPDRFWSLTNYLVVKI